MTKRYHLLCAVSGMGWAVVAYYMGGTWRGSAFWGGLVSAPLIGLLGTVIGIIKSFTSMAVEGSGGFAVVAGGISEALIATALGLAVGIIAVIFYNYFHTKLERIEAAMTISSDRVLEAVRLGRKAHGNG